MQRSRPGRRRYTRRGFVRGLGVAAGIFALAPALAACGSKSKASGSTASGEAGARPRRGGTLTVRSMGDVSNLDYASAADLVSKFVINQSVEALVSLDAQAQPRGLLAENWETPDDHTYIFKLRQGVTFQDGTAFNAGAVEYSRGRLYQGSANNAGQKPPTIEKPDPGTIKFVLPAPNAPFLIGQESTAAGVISPATAEKYGADRLKLDLAGLGTGPLKFVEWRKDDQVALVRNEAYWGRGAGGMVLPYLDKLIVRPVPDASQALASLRNGEVDAFRPLEAPATKDLAAVRNDPSLNYRAVAGHGFSFIAFNVTREPFNSRELRQAVSYAGDRGALVQSLFERQAPPLDVIFGESSWAYDRDYHPYLTRDVAKAKQLLAQAGRPNGFAFTLLNSAPQQLSELIQDQLREAGIGVSIQQLEFPALQTAQRKGEQQAALSGWGGDVDPSAQVNPHFSSVGFQNFQSRYHSPDLDPILLRAQTTLDMAERKPLYQQAQRLIMSDAPYCMLFSNLSTTLSSRKVHDYPLRIGDTVSLGQVWKER